MNIFRCEKYANQVYILLNTLLKRKAFSLFNRNTQDEAQELVMEVSLLSLENVLEVINDQSNRVRILKRGVTVPFS